MLLDRLDAERAVAAAAREDDADGAFSCWSSASEWKKMSMVLPWPRGVVTRSMPRSMVSVPLGGMTCTRLGSTAMPSLIATTGMCV